MAESINQRMVKVPDELTSREIRQLFVSILADLQTLQSALNTHTHGGVTVGAGTSGAANAGTVSSLNTQA